MLDLGSIYGVMGQTERKIEAYQRVLADYRHSIFADEAQYLLARAFEDAGRVQEALETYESLLQDFPTSIYLEESRARIRSLRGRGQMQ